MVSAAISEMGISPRNMIRIGGDQGEAEQDDVAHRGGGEMDEIGAVVESDRFMPGGSRPLLSSCNFC